MAEITDNKQLLGNILRLIDDAKKLVTTQVNSTMTMLYWRIGRTINEHVLGGERADYGKQIIAKLSHQLRSEYGETSFSEKHLRQMMRFAEAFRSEEIVYTLCRQLTWSHIRMLIPIEDELQRQFYIELLHLDDSNIRVADYLTKLPERKILERKLQQAIEIAKNRLTNG